MPQKQSTKDVTLRSLSQQMMEMEQRLDKRIDTSVHGLQAAIGAGEARLINDIASIGALDRHETRAAESRLSVRLDRVEKNLESLQHLDARVVDIEVVQIPKLKKVVGIR